MKRTLSVLGASLLMCLATAGTASALEPVGGPLFGQSQTSSQSQNGSNSVSQDASSKAISAPLAQINLNVPISLLSPGDNGKVEQSNSSSATSSASNDSVAIQGVEQSQGSDQSQDGTQTAGGGSPSFEQGQAADQSQNASNSVDQNASSTAVSKPGPQVNVNLPIRVLSPGIGRQGSAVEQLVGRLVGLEHELREAGSRAGAELDTGAGRHAEGRLRMQG